MAEIKLQKRAVYAGDVHIALLKAGWIIADATRFVREMPTAEVEPVRHGHWIDCEDEYSSYVRCSVCGSHDVRTEIATPVWSDRCKHLAKCHNCGLRTGFEETEHIAIEKWNRRDVFGTADDRKTEEPD